MTFEKISTNEAQTGQQAGQFLYFSDRASSYNSGK